MTTQIGIGFSHLLNTEEAAKDSAFRSINNLDLHNLKLTLFFTTPQYDPERILPIIQRIIPEGPMSGCSVPGIIIPNAIKEQGILIINISSDELSFGTSFCKDIHKKDSQTLGNNFAQEIIKTLDEQSRCILTYFFDSSFTENSSFLLGLQQILGNIFPIIGFGSAPPGAVTDSLQFYNYNILKNSVTGMLLGGNLTIGVGCAHGWRPLGKPRHIDKAEGNIIKSIDGKTPISMYEEFFENSFETLYAPRHQRMSLLYPLGMKMEGEKEYLLRNVFDFLSDGSMVCQGDFPPNAEIHLMLAKKDSCMEAAVQAAQEAKKNLNGKQPKLILVFESMARLKLLGRSAFDEIQKINEVFNYTVPPIGIYCNGEIGPLQPIEHSNLTTSKKSILQNNSILVFAIS